VKIVLLDEAQDRFEAEDGGGANTVTRRISSQRSSRLHCGRSLPQRETDSSIGAAMEAGIADHVWSSEEIVGLL
jgi:hypothetical protein